MKTNIFTIIMALLIGFQTSAQNLNQEITNKGQKPYLLGKFDKSGLEGDNYDSWFTKNYDAYNPNLTITNSIASELGTYSITLFMGTWCGDSKKEVPRLYKVLDACNFPMEQLTAVAVSRQAGMYKQSPQHEEKGLNIHRVPTIIFYKNGKEVNRIVEHPIITIEEDIMAIITTNKYKSNYQIVTVVDDILNKKGTKGLRRKKEKLIKTYKGKVSSMYELNTYGHILNGTDRKDEALAVFALNTELFPDQSRAYLKLADTFSSVGQKEKAIQILEDAIKLLPENDDLKENLTLIKSN